MTLPQAFYTTPIAHRGFHHRDAGRPENSFAAFQAAIDRGYGIELDVQLSRDGVALVFHDYALDRLTGQTGAIRQRDADDLCQITLTGGSDTIPTLPQVLELIAGRVPLLVEIKDQDGAMGVNVGQLEDATAQILHRYAGPVAVMSFNPNSVQQMAIHAPQIPRGLVTCGYTAQDWPLLGAATRHRLRDIPDFDTVSASFISHDVVDLQAVRLLALKAQGTPILCWTVRSAEQETDARQVADNITFEGYLPAIGP